MKETFSSVEHKNKVCADSYLIPSNTGDYVVGRICTLIETLGLRDTQETAAKSLAKQEIYSALAGGRYVNSDLANLIFAAQSFEKEEAKTQQLPGITADYELTVITK